MSQIEMYMQDVTGAIRVWRCETKSDGLRMEFGLLDGAMIEKEEYIPSGKQGRTQQEQIQSRFDSRVWAQRCKGYSEDINDASKQPVNIIGQGKPMLAHKYDQNRVDWGNAFIQRKYNGLRCLIAGTAYGTIAYSRNGKKLPGTEFLIKDFDLPDGIVLDGELYHHGSSLQEIASWAKRLQPDSKKLRHIAYDIALPASFGHRLEALSAYTDSIAETDRVYNHTAVMDKFMEYRGEGFEGAIVRHGHKAYETGKRSFSLLKVKDWQDAEFLVIDINPSKDGWAILTCELPNGDTFDVAAPGTMEDKYSVMSEAEYYIGRYINVEFAELTPYGIPFHPVARYWRS